MPGTGPAPKPPGERRNRVKPSRGEIRTTVGTGWQHGPVPKCPDGLLATSRTAWATWMGAWFAANWNPHDLPILRQVIVLFDKVERNDASSAEMTQYRQLLDSYGITPKGQQDRRWAPPKEQPAATASADPADPYAHLRVVS